MVKMNGPSINTCMCNVASGNVPTIEYCGLEAVYWNVSWDVTGQITNVVATCGKHKAKKPTKRDVEKWGSHEITRDVAEALARRSK